MGALEQVIQMKSQGVSEGEIIRSLQQQGVSPREIQSALSQAQIKSAVMGEEFEAMQPSIMQQDEEYSQEQYDAGEYVPQPGGVQEEYSQYVPQPQPYYNYSQEYAPQEEMQGEYMPYAPSMGGTDTETIMEIADQVVNEKTKDVRKQMDDLNEFKAITQSRIDMLSEKIQRIESIIDKLQISILERVGSYGEGIDSIKKEMSMMQDSFGKVINKVAEHREHKTSSKAKKKN